MATPVDFTDIDTQMRAYGTTIKSYIDDVIFLAGFDGTAQIPTGLIPSSATPDTIVGADSNLVSTQPTTPDTTLNIGFSGSYPVLGFTSFSTLAVPAVPTAPAINLGTAPVTNLPSVPNAPVLNQVALPVKPDVSIPAVPLLADINIPTLVVPVLPTFDFTSPDVPDDLVVPDIVFEYSEEDYISTELTNLRNLLNDDLVNGGWGVNHVDEEQLFERQKERIRREALLKEEELFDTFSARGFSIPQGDQVDQVRKLQKETLDKVENVNLDVSISRADLIRKSRENVIAQTNVLNGAMTQFQGFMRQRLLGAAQFLAQHSLNVFGAQVTRHNLLIEAYNSNVRGYQAQVDAALAQIQISKTEIEAQALINEVNKSTIDLYQAQVESAVLLIQLYQTEINAAKTLSEIERDKLEVYKTETEVYKAQIDGEVSKAELYNTQLGAERIKSQIYATSISAFEAEVRAEVARGQHEINAAEVRSRDNFALIARYNSEIDVYRNNISIAASEMDARVAAFGTESSVYGSYASAYSSFLRSRMTEENIKISSQVDLSKLELERSRFNTDTANEGIRNLSNATAKAADAYANFATGFASITNSLQLE